MEYIKKKLQHKAAVNPKKLFLLSLLPDLDLMNYHQMRPFRIQFSRLIDDILSTTNETSSISSTIFFFFFYKINIRLLTSVNSFVLLNRAHK